MSATVTPYTAEEFTDEESDILRPYFTNLHKPVFALVNLPEVVKGALFARYSRSAKSLRLSGEPSFLSRAAMNSESLPGATVLSSASMAEASAIPRH